MSIEEIARKIAVQAGDQFPGGIPEDLGQVRLGLAQMDEVALRSLTAAQSIPPADADIFFAWLRLAAPAQTLQRDVRRFGVVPGRINVREVLRAGQIDLPIQGNEVRLELHETGLPFEESQRFCEMVLEAFAHLVESRREGPPVGVAGVLGGGVGGEY